jgi:hypothetical protein
LEADVGEVKPAVSASGDHEDNAAAIKPAETSTQPTEKGVSSKAMDYQVAMTSPTELLAPDVFSEDITDMNGNATMNNKHQSKVVYHQGGSNRRCLLWILIFFITTTLIMAALFTWKMVDPDDSDDSTKNNIIHEVCFKIYHHYTRIFNHIGMSFQLIERRQCKTYTPTLLRGLISEIIC